MVFCGKPSKGCGQCRSRKIRCDQIRPACSQCIKGNRVCPGYRDELSLMFRDESQQVVRKAKTGSSHSKPKASKGSSRTLSQNSPQTESGVEVSVQSEVIDFNIDPQQQILQQIASSPFGVRPSSGQSEFEAICFFARYNTWPGALWTLDTTPNLFGAGRSSSVQAMKTSMVSAGMAMLSRMTKSQPLKLLAERQYGSALKVMNTALSNPVDAKANATLAAVLVLALFEIITSRAPRTIENWTNHIRGATTLLELRGVEQFYKPEGLQLFLQLRFQIIISCLQRGTYVPKTLLECTEIAMFLRPQQEAYGDHLIRICGKLANLRADIDAKVLVDSTEIISSAYAIEAELIAWLAALPPNFSYTTVENARIDSSFRDRCRGLLPYGNRYHIYRSFWVCNIWNQYRSARIMINQYILGYTKALARGKPASSLPFDLQTQLRAVRSTIQQLAADICASIPYHFGVGDVENSLPGASPQTESFIGGFILLWPLYLAGATEGKNHPLRKWATECLKLVGHSMGIDQALALVDILDTEAHFAEAELSTC